MPIDRRDIVLRLGEESDFVVFDDPNLGSGIRLMTEEERRQDAIREIKWLRSCNEDLEILLRGRTAELRAEVNRLTALVNAIYALPNDGPLSQIPDIQESHYTLGHSDGWKRYNDRVKQLINSER